MRPDAILTAQVLLMQLLQQILAAESTALVNWSWAQTTCVLIVCCLLGDILFFWKTQVEHLQQENLFTSFY